MIALDSIIVLGSQSTNKKGDLFASSMSSLFSVLGYRDFRFNIHKTGREIDIEAVHSTEPRRLIAECKATADSIGGTEINAFMGKVDVERHKDPKATLQPYFVSLSGFTESAIEQEKDARNRVVLLDGTRVIDRLVEGKVLIDKAAAAERSGRIAALSSDVRLHPKCHLVISDYGNLWLFFYTQDNARISYSFIHGDGTFISSKLAQELNRDPALKSLTRGLGYIAPKSSPDETTALSTVKRKYTSYLAKVCGEIPLDGLPADQEMGTKRLKLESLFVPLKLNPLRPDEPIAQSEAKASADERQGPKIRRMKERLAAIPVGEVLKRERRLAILGLPGSGKSTLIKRLATAYAFPSRKSQIDDNLPDHRWLPIFLRCRQLGNSVRDPILKVLSEICGRAEIDETQREAFRKMILDAVKGGNALLLVDGLDEISSDSDRVAFVGQLRLFLSQYPAISMIITSRIAGFRVIGNALSSECAHYTLAPFDAPEITKLTVAWQTVVAGKGKDAQESAGRLAQAICSNHRLMKLAENPLLLTTLLLVKRWVTQLPTKRSALYGRAVEVLLMTWNVEGHQPLDPEEVVPQLAYVALQMMKSGVQRIASSDLQRELLNARRAMPEILGYAKMNVPDFIAAVELRSSLLLLSGHEYREGSIQPVYEFRHLLFQEYLAAQAVVESYLPDGTRKTICDILRPHFADDSWEEVIVLSASLAGRASVELMRELTIAAQSVSVEKVGPRSRPINELLAQCLADEVPLANPELDAALTEIIPLNDLEDLELSRYSSEFRSVCSQQLWSGTRFRKMSCGVHIGEIDYLRILAGHSTRMEIAEAILVDLSREGREGVEALFSVALGAYARAGRTFFAPTIPRPESLQASELDIWARIGDLVTAHLRSDQLEDQVGASWALSWLGNRGYWTVDRDYEVIRRLFSLWRTTADQDVRYLSVWAIISLPVKTRSYWKNLELDSDPRLRSHVESLLTSASPSMNDRAISAALLYELYMGRLKSNRSRNLEILRTQRDTDDEAFKLLATELGTTVEELRSHPNARKRRIAANRPLNRGSENPKRNKQATK